MNKDVFLHVPENVETVSAAKSKFIRQNELRQNRDVSHILKSSANERHSAKRITPHVRGR